MLSKAELTKFSNAKQCWAKQRWANQS